MVSIVRHLNPWLHIDTDTDRIQQLCQVVKTIWISSIGSGGTRSISPTRKPNFLTESFTYDGDKSTGRRASFVNLNQLEAQSSSSQPYRSPPASFAGSMSPSSPLAASPTLSTTSSTPSSTTTCFPKLIPSSFAFDGPVVRVASLQDVDFDSII